MPSRNAHISNVCVGSMSLESPSADGFSAGTGFGHCQIREDLGRPDSCMESRMTDYQERARHYHAAIRRILLTEWDPIGVSHFPEDQDEYESYVGGGYKILFTNVYWRYML